MHAIICYDIHAIKYNCYDMYAMLHIIAVTGDSSKTNNTRASDTFKFQKELIYSGRHSEFTFQSSQISPF